MINLAKEYKKTTVALAVIAVLAVAVAARTGSSNEKAQDGSGDTQQTKTVELVNLQSFTRESPLVKTTGEVEALEQVELKSEVSARVVAVPAVLGQEVVAGQQLVVFDSAGLGAQKRQAEAAFERAQAQLAQLEAQLNAQEALHAQTLVTTQHSVAAAEAALKTAENNLQQKNSTATSGIVQDAYDNARLALLAVQNTVSGIMLDADSILGEDNKVTNDLFEKELARLDPSTLVGARDAYAQAKAQKKILDERFAQLDAQSAHAQIDEALELSAAMLEQLQLLVQRLGVVLDNTRPVGDLTPAKYDALLALVQADREKITAQRLGVVKEQQAISTAKTGLTSVEIAYQKALDDKEAVVAQADAQRAGSEAQLAQARSSLVAQQAEVKRARATVDGISADLAKTVIRSPIGGTVAFLALRGGELASPGMLIASVVNNTGLQVTTFVDSSQLAFVNIGTRARIDGRFEGNVIRTAPSIDPQTKKVEVVIALTEKNLPLVVGQFVDVELFSSSTDMLSGTLVPLSAVRITAQERSVFVISEQQTAQVLPVEISRIIGDTVEVVSGLENVTEIIRSVRGLESGMPVLAVRQ